LKSHDELVVLDRIDGDATVAPPQHAIIFGAKSSGGVPVRMNDPFEWRSVIDVTVVGGGAFEYCNDHVSINSSVVPVHNRPVVIHRFGMSVLSGPNGTMSKSFWKPLNLMALTLGPLSLPWAA